MGIIDDFLKAHIVNSDVDCDDELSEATDLESVLQWVLNESAPRRDVS